MKIIGLLDCDSFFASCEKVFRPDWANRPVVVLSNNDGCVVARSPEAKALQIAMGAPFFQIKELVRRENVVVRSANFALYADLSRRVVQTLAQWTPDIDVYSIDEAFFDLTGRFCDPAGNIGDENRRLPTNVRREVERLAAEIVETTRRWTGIPVSIGIAPTRTLAKAASRLAKTDAPRTGRKFALLFDADERERELKRLPIGDVWGVGRRLLPTFQRLGLRTALDLSRVDPLYMRKNFSVVQEKTVRELNGERIFNAVERPEPQKSLQTSRSFGETVESLDELEEAVSSFAASTAEKLRRRSLVASGVYVYLATSRFQAGSARRFAGYALNFPKPTNATPEFLSTALKILRYVFAPNFAYKKAGVVALETLEESVAAERRYLFEPDPERSDEIRERDRKLMRAVDQLNGRFGKKTVFFASEGVERRWNPRSEHVSPCYTTDWNALPIVYAK